MKNFDLPIYQNPLKSKSDFEHFLMETLRPLEEAFVANGTRLHLSNTCSGARDEVSGIEGFSRIIWGLAVHDNMGPDHEWWVRIRRGLIVGTDPAHDSYFGVVSDYDQRIVEMAAIGYAFVLRRECIYDPLTEEQKKNLITWLNQTNECEAYNCNWKFFRVMVDIGLESLGVPYDRTKMEAYLEDLDHYYLQDGWYRDGDVNGAHADYYIPFAMHFYGLFYAKYMKSKDPERAKRYEERAVAFAEQFIYWFAASGESLPYGRSLTYRYAQVGFWSMLVVSDVELPFSLGVIKGIILRHFRWWNNQPIYDRRGQLTIGYAYENHYLVEGYISPGSVYWGLKSLAFLTLPHDHEFWKVEEEPLPVLEDASVQEAPRLIIKRDTHGKHLLAYNGGSYHTNGHVHVECKYEKFVYSTLFGFSVPRSHRHLAFGAYDNTLAISEDGTYYRHKDRSTFIQIDESIMHMQWKPYSNVCIDSYIVMGYPWHIRIHRIKTDRHIMAAEGGFAIGLETCKHKQKAVETVQVKNGIYAITESDYSGVIDLTGNQQPVIIYPASNTNIMNPRTLLPTLKSEFEPGEHVIGSFIEGHLGKPELGYVRDVVIQKESITIKLQEDKQIDIQFNA
ncbi:DUF2264 domain-containing protein [Vallitalea pronyensis]|uniref:DUF2264 domain-containing protein n=1 Tax=Vallitalea pronyensis TaxID=1348613 RepID=A0A8J8MPD9_9FIRM|nr:DUF2264 domain-containing protein [Vallitalea pronyensis]QUI25535.1 DUF2264 domain-containing protein [Vallitalea pronyensis]